MSSLYTISFTSLFSFCFSISSYPSSITSPIYQQVVSGDGRVCSPFAMPPKHPVVRNTLPTHKNVSHQHALTHTNTYRHTHTTHTHVHTHTYSQLSFISTNFRSICITFSSFLLSSPLFPPLYPPPHLLFFPFFIALSYPSTSPPPLSPFSLFSLSSSLFSLLS